MKEQYRQQHAGSNRSLAQLEPLLGRWKTVGAHPAFSEDAHGVSSFEWLLDGGLLLWRFTWEEPGPPSATCVIGRDDSEPDCSMVYADERGVTRIYRMSLEGGVWKMWRDAPNFAQRMTGRFADGGNTISVHGELARDGGGWEQDLDVTYTRMQALA